MCLSFYNFVPDPKKHHRMTNHCYFFGVDLGQKNVARMLTHDLFVVSSSIVRLNERNCVNVRMCIMLMSLAVDFLALCFIFVEWVI